jgi:hypothetical protein
MQDHAFQTIAQHGQFTLAFGLLFLDNQGIANNAFIAVDAYFAFLSNVSASLNLCVSLRFGIQKVKGILLGNFCHNIV